MVKAIWATAILAAGLSLSPIADHGAAAQGAGHKPGGGASARAAGGARMTGPSPRGNIARSGRDSRPVARGDDGARRFRGGRDGSRVAGWRYSYDDDPYYDGDGYYGRDDDDDCRSLLRRARATGSRIWWRRYRECIE